MCAALEGEGLARWFLRRSDGSFNLAFEVFIAQRDGTAADHLEDLDDDFRRAVLIALVVTA